MRKLIGTHSFEENIIVGAGGQRQFEYGGPLNATPDAQAPKEKERKTLAQRIGERIRNLMGGVDNDAVSEAQALRRETRDSDRIDQYAAGRIADMLARRSDVEIRRSLPDMAPGPIPRHPDLRWVAVGSAAIDAVHRHVDNGSNERLSPGLGRAARIGALHDIDARVQAPTVEALLSNLTHARSNEIRNYLATGPAIDAARERHADHPLSKDVGLKGVEREMAAARLGFVPSHEIVHRANVFGRTSGLDPNMLKGQYVEMPEHMVRGVTISGRERAIESAIVQGREHPLNGPKADPLIRDMAKRAKEMASTDVVSGNSFDRTPLPLSKQALKDMYEVRHAHDRDVKAMDLSGPDAERQRDSLAHRYMSVMLRDAYATHPSVARTLDEHAKQIRKESTPQEEARRGITATTDNAVASRMTITAKAQSAIADQYPKRDDQEGRNVQMQRHYAREMDLPAPSRAARMEQFAAAGRSSEAKAETAPAPKATRTATIAAMTQGRSL